MDSVENPVAYGIVGFSIVFTSAIWVARISISGFYRFTRSFVAILIAIPLN